MPLIEKIWAKLRFRELGYYHSRLYKQKLWDGYTDFFKKQNGKFLTGLLPEVRVMLKMSGEPFEVIDKRNAIEFTVKEIDENYLPGIKLYDYQVELVNALLKHKRGTIQAPTSSGKTHILSCGVKSLPEGTPTLILANRKSLVEQNYRELKNWGLPVGRVYDKYNDPNVITCSTVQSIKKIAKDLKKIRALFVDEIHDNMSKGPKAIYNKLINCSIRAAISATPYKFDGEDLCQKWSVKGYFGSMFETKEGVLTTKKLQDRGILSASRCVFYPVREPELPYEIYLDSVTKGIAENWHFHDMVKRLALAQQGRTLILVDRVAHGDALASMIPGALWVQGKDDLETRKHVIDRLSTVNDSVIAIATQQIFNTGVNSKMHNLINAAGGQAQHQIIQRMGRGLRTIEDKTILNYYDFVFHINDYLLKHSKKRIRILKKEGHEVIIKDEVDF